SSTGFRSRSPRRRPRGAPQPRSRGGRPAPPASRSESATRGGAPPTRRDRPRRPESSCRRGRRRSHAWEPRAAATILRRMAREEKWYRVYRGGRVRGGVPLRTKPAPRDGTDGGDGRSRYRGPSKPARERKRWGWGRRIGVGLAALVVLLVVWSVAGYLSFFGGVSDANQRVRPAKKAGL